MRKRTASTTGDGVADPPRKKRAPKKSGVDDALPEKNELKIAEAQSKPKSPKAAKEKAVSHQVLTDREKLPKLWDSAKAAANGSYSK